MPYYGDNPNTEQVNEELERSHFFDFTCSPNWMISDSVLLFQDGRSVVRHDLRADCSWNKSYDSGKGTDRDKRAPRT